MRNKASKIITEKFKKYVFANKSFLFRCFSYLPLFAF